MPATTATTRASSDEHDLATRLAAVQKGLLSLSARDSLAFVQALRSPWEPDDALRAEIQQLHGLVGDD